MADINKYLAEKKDLVDRVLQKYFPPEPPFFGVMFYSLETGKRIRPILTLATYEALGGKNLEEIMPVACALELIHTYSLIHDDLPAMDNDDFRRGKPTAHKQFGEALAILSGDGLYAYAFELLAQGSNLINERYRVIQTVSAAVGPKGIVYGQVLDIEDHHSADPRTLRRIHFNKTAKFICAPIKCGAIMARAPESTIRVLEWAGVYLGMLFQYTDDILDVVGKKEELGKTPGKDLSAGKLTAARVYGLPGARFRARRYAEKARGLFAGLGSGFAILEQITDFVLNRSF
jgi:geranylgeranyl diphosphate synthase type II